MRFMLQVFFEPGFYEPYKAAVVFICGEPYGPDFKLRCETYDPFAGANAVVLLKEIVSAEPSGPPPGAEVERRDLTTLSRDLGGMARLHVPAGSE